MKLSCIVVSYQVRDLLRLAVASVADADEVIVVDNGSTDGSAQMVRQEFPGAHVHVLPSNPGFGVAVNFAAARASGDAYLLLNPDAALRPGQVNEIKTRLEMMPQAAAIGFRQVDEDDRFQLAHGGEAALGSELLRMVTQRAIDARVHWIGSFADRMSQATREVAWVSASSLVVRREAFERIRGFDPEFFLFFEDIDFCLRLRDAGLPVYYDPTLTVLHRRGKSAERDASSASTAYRRSQLRFWRKRRGPLLESMVKLYQRARGVSPS